MSMMRKIFRPAKGERHQRFTAAIATVTDLYRGDVVVWDSSATPTAITWGGVTLDANDFVFVTTQATVANASGRQAGLVVGGDGTGSAMTNMDTTTAVCTATTGSLVVIQTWGVFETHANAAATTPIAGSLLILDATAGELADVLVTDIATDVTGPTLVGVSLGTDATYTRGTVTTNTGVTAFVRCDF